MNDSSNDPRSEESIAVLPLEQNNTNDATTTVEEKRTVVSSASTSIPIVNCTLVSSATSTLMVPEQMVDIVDTVEITDLNHIPLPTGTGEEEEEEYHSAEETERHRHHRYEIIPGLWAQLSEDADVTIRQIQSQEQAQSQAQAQTQTDLNGDIKDMITECVIRTKRATLGESFFTADNVHLKAKIIKRRGNNSDSKWDDVVVRDLVLSMENLAVDPLVDRKQIMEFLETFGSLPPADTSTGGNTTHLSLPKRRLTREEWQRFLINAHSDSREQNYQMITRETDNSNNDMNLPATTTGTNTKATSAKPSSQTVNFTIPLPKVHATKCKLPNGTTIDFPSCEGSAECTIRILLEYYVQSIVHAMDLQSGAKARIDPQAVASDMSSAGGSIVGAAVGTALLGPVGFVAGSVLGSKFGRNHSGSIVGATAGAALFGPVGLVAGAYYGGGGGSKRTTDNIVDNHDGTKLIGGEGKEPGVKGLRKAASEHISTNKYNYAGSTGVLAGAAAGAPLGPIGMMAGAYVGSVSARTIVEKASSSRNNAFQSPKKDNESTTTLKETKPSYKFGDYTRNIVARGKESRGAEQKQGYKFGDFTRGLLNSRG